MRSQQHVDVKSMSHNYVITIVLSLHLDFNNKPVKFQILSCTVVMVCWKEHLLAGRQTGSPACEKLRAERSVFLPEIVEQNSGRKGLC